MNLIERYILRIVTGAFLACLIALTGVIWITQALRELDLLTSKGQTIMIFLTVTGLSIPTLVTVISPVALFIAMIYTLNKLNGDSELIVMSAAGVPPARLLKPFLALAGAVSLLVVFMTTYIMPASFQELRDVIQKVRGDFLANVVKEGQFTTLDNGVTFHFRERSGDALLGIFMQDRREAGKTTVYLSERGQTVEVNGQSYLILEKGSVHRQQPNSRDSSIVAFQRYAIDLAAFNQEGGDTVYKPRERSTGQLLFPNEKELYYQMQAGRFRAELHDRLSSWLYPLAMALIAFAALGDAVTTRQGRGLAVTGAVIAVVGLRIAGFAASSAAVRSPGAVYAIWLAPLAALGVALAICLYGQRSKALLAGLGRRSGRIVLPRLPRLRRAAS
ncbi:MAG TPA: LPS export ABC transporter permease LptF [Beijerinckiaceae bacterium]|jgi:lipopolysaccharide export system permease protein